MSSATTRLSAGSSRGLCPGAVSPAGACPRIFVDAFSVALVGFIGHACALHRRLHDVLPPKLQRAMDLGREKGASSWLVTLPIEEYNFALPAKLLSEVCPNVEVQPALQPPTGERLTSRTAISDDEANLDVRAQGFWRHRGQCVFFDVRVFNPVAPSNSRSSLNTTYRFHKSLWRRSYEQRIRDVERG